MSDKETKSSAEVNVSREDISPFETYWGTAKHLAEKFNLDEGQCEYIARCIKSYGHHDKLSVYSRLRMYSKDGTIDFLQYILDTKVKTHKHYANLDIDLVF